MPTKILEGMKKAYINAVIVIGLHSATIKLVNEQMECNISVQTMRRVLEAASFEA